jgi:formylglycine-generating enzyme
MLVAALALCPALSAGCTCGGAPDEQTPPPPPSAVVVFAARPGSPPEPGLAGRDARLDAGQVTLTAPSAAPTADPSAGSPPVGGPASASSLAPATPEPGAPADPSAGERPLHIETQEGLLSLFTIRAFSEKERKRRGDPELFLHKNVGPEGPWKSNQGNKAVAHHLVSREACLAGLAGVTIQTAEQRQRCGGAENMVPIYKSGDMGKAKVCMDVFEFPNKPCELPFVWISPVQAQVLCEMEGKRLCAQEEWVMACRADPEGKEDWLYAYGNDLDLKACNTDKPARSFGGPVCEPESARSAWGTCGTNTEPTGSSPRCRSRLGVFDMHGNVAEIMTRYDADGHTYSQLKGSAFFYVDVARKHNERPAKDATRETYPDHCAHDPRWHVEPMATAWHVNYHLGFRCCKTVR